MRSASAIFSKLLAVRFSHYRANPRTSIPADTTAHRPAPTIGGSIISGLPVFVGGAFDQREAPGFFGSAGSNFLHFDCNRAALFPVVRFLFACIGYRQRLLLPGVMR